MPGSGRGCSCEARPAAGPDPAGAGSASASAMCCGPASSAVSATSCICTSAVVPCPPGRLAGWSAAGGLRPGGRLESGASFWRLGEGPGLADCAGAGLPLLAAAGLASSGASASACHAASDQGIILHGRACMHWFNGPCRSDAQNARAHLWLGLHTSLEAASSLSLLLLLLMAASWSS